MYAQCNICSFTALDEKQWNEHTSSTRHKLNDFIYYEGVKAGQYQADAKLRQALTEANALYNTVEAINLDLTERIEYANAGDLVTIPRELVLAMEAKMKAQAETIARLEAELAQCKHEEEDTCTCGHSLDSHKKSGVHPCKECECAMFWRDDDGDMCECGHPKSEHTHDGDNEEKGCMHRILSDDGLYCPCMNYEAAK